MIDWIDFFCANRDLFIATFSGFFMIFVGLRVYMWQFRRQQILRVRNLFIGMLRYVNKAANEGKVLFLKRCKESASTVTQEVYDEYRLVNKILDIYEQRYNEDEWLPQHLSDAIDGYLDNIGKCNEERQINLLCWYSGVIKTTEDMIENFINLRVFSNRWLN